jgi:hypothetical protein
VEGGERVLHADIKSMTHALNIRMQIGAARSPKEEDIFDFPHRHICNLKKWQKRAAVNPLHARVCPLKAKETHSGAGGRK